MNGTTLPPIDNDDHLSELQNQDIHAIVSAFLQSVASAGQQLVEAVVSLLDKIAANAAADLQRLIDQLLSTLTDRQFYNGLFNALKAHIKAHPWSMAFFIGIVLLCNPLAMAGFGALGPVAAKSIFSSPFYGIADWK